MFNIAEFKTRLDGTGGVLRNNKFRIRFLPPRTMLREGYFRELEYLAESVSLPGVNMSSHDVRRYGYGPIEKRPIGHTFTDVNVTFIADGNGDVHRIMTNWLQTIGRFDMRSGIASENLPFQLQYKIEYVTDLHVQVFTEDGEPSIDVVLREAFPISLSDAQFSWNDLNNYARFTMQFAYNDWFIEPNSRSKLRR
jgi:hypothetical protein